MSHCFKITPKDYPLDLNPSRCNICLEEISNLNSENPNQDKSIVHFGPNHMNTPSILHVIFCSFGCLDSYFQSSAESPNQKIQCPYCLQTIESIDNPETLTSLARIQNLAEVKNFLHTKKPSREDQTRALKTSIHLKTDAISQELLANLELSTEELDSLAELTVKKHQANTLKSLLLKGRLSKDLRSSLILSSLLHNQKEMFQSLILNGCIDRNVQEAIVRECSRQRLLPFLQILINKSKLSRREKNKILELIPYQDNPEAISLLNNCGRINQKSREQAIHTSVVTNNANALQALLPSRNLVSKKALEDAFWEALTLRHEDIVQILLSANPNLLKKFKTFMAKAYQNNDLKTILHLIKLYFLHPSAA